MKRLISLLAILLPLLLLSQVDGRDTMHVVNLKAMGDMTCYGDMSNYASITADNNTIETQISLIDSWFLFSLFDSDSQERSSDGNYISNNITISMVGNYSVSFNASGESAGVNKGFEFRIFELWPTMTNITDATQTNPVIITAAGHGFSNGNKIAIKSVGGMVEINDRIFTILGVSGDTFKLIDDGGASPANDIDGTGFTEYTSGGTVQLVTQTSVHSNRFFSAAGGNSFGSYSGSDFILLDINCTLEYYIKCTSVAPPANFIQESCVLKIKKLQL